MIKVPAERDDQQHDQEEEGDEKAESNIVLQPQKRKKQVFNRFELVRGINMHCVACVIRVSVA